MKYIFTLLFFLPFTVMAQFEAIVNRILTDREPEIRISTIGCCICMMGVNNNGFFENPINDIPPVRRSLEGLSLNISRSPSADTVVSPPKPQPCRVFLRCQATPIGNEPLLVVDGLPKDSMNELKNIPVENIESIDILKDAAASALYGYRAARGVVLVNAKSSSIRTLLVSDEVNGQAVSRASLRFVSVDQKQILQVAANDSGVLVTDQLKRDGIYDVTITAVGYKPLTVRFKNNWFQSQPEKWLMQRDIRTNEEVVISYYIHHRICRCFSCRIKGSRIRQVSKDIKGFSGASIFPNPARPGQSLTLQQEMKEEAPLRLHLFNAAGQQVQIENYKALKGKNQFRFSTAPGTSTGTYFYQLRYANGQLLTSGKFIIQ